MQHVQLGFRAHATCASKGFMPMQHVHVGLNALATCLVKARLKATGLKGSSDQGPSPCPYHHDHYVFCPLLGATV